MTQRNIDVMDIIVSKMAEGAKLSKALKLVYEKRNVRLPYSEADLNVSIINLGMSSRTTNALMRARLATIKDVIDFCEGNQIIEVKNFGKISGIELFETILDYCWENMTNNERTNFLIDTVERNSEYIREEIV